MAKSGIERTREKADVVALTCCVCVAIELMLSWCWTLSVWLAKKQCVCALNVCACCLWIT